MEAFLRIPFVSFTLKEMEFSFTSSPLRDDRHVAPRLSFSSCAKSSFLFSRTDAPLNGFFRHARKLLPQSFTVRALARTSSSLSLFPPFVGMRIVIHDFSSSTKRLSTARIPFPSETCHDAFFFFHADALSVSDRRRLLFFSCPDEEDTETFSRRQRSPPSASRVPLSSFFSPP